MPDRPGVSVHVVITASGEVPADGLEFRRDLMASADLLIAADGGLAHCAEADIWPQFVVGDLDSARSEDVAAAVSNGTVVSQVSADKDETDLELALARAADLGATSVTVVGLFGGRIDHELANISLLAADRWAHADIAMLAADGRRRLWIVRGTLELAEPVGTTISVLPWNGPAHGVSNHGLEWPLDQATLPAGTPLGMSNVASASRQSVTVDDGVALVIIDGS